MLQLSEDKTNKNQLHPQGQTRVRPAADLIGVNYQTLRRWWQTDKFPKPININGILLFRNSDLLAWLEGHQADNDNDQSTIAPAQEA
ncbi:helix-turn-helix transcriptional regulator [Psychrobacter sp.]|uniref:helix-turn-helix transcriptional regulator n=1 Tax=Psychrobacter sp. TaxID=56811 RepID=UPI002FDA0EB4